MNADIIFGNVEFYGAPSGQRIRVKVGEGFDVNLNDAPEGIVWATTSDPVLTLNDVGFMAKVRADAVGMSEIQVQVNRAVVMYIAVEVYSLEAASLGIKAGQPEPK